MTRTQGTFGLTESQAKETVKKVATSRWVVRLARFGYASKGIVYIVIGALATLAATGFDESPKDARGALHTIASQPSGGIMLGVVAVGLVGYVLWRWVQAVADADGKGSGLKGLSIRAGYFLSGIVYAGLAVTAAQIILYARAVKSGEARREWTELVMNAPYGRWLIGVAGACVVVFGLYQIYKGYKAKFRKRLKLGQMGRGRDRWGTLFGRVGYAARGVVFCIVGVFLVQAALHYDASEIKGLDGALQSLADQAYGQWILGTVAVGLIAYGLYMFVEARYRIIADS